MIECNGKTVTFNMKARIRGDYDKVAWYNPEFSTNTVSLKNLTKWRRVTFNSDNDSFTIHRPNKPDMTFESHQDGKYLYDIKFHASEQRMHPPNQESLQNLSKKVTIPLKEISTKKNVDDIDHDVIKSKDKFSPSCNDKINDDDNSQEVHPRIAGVVVEKNEENKENDKDVNNP